MIRRLLATALAAILLGFGIASAYHEHDGPVGCRSTPHVHVDHSPPDCPACRLSRLGAIPDVCEAPVALVPHAQPAPVVAPDLLALFLPATSLSRAPPVFPTRCF